MDKQQVAQKIMKLFALAAKAGSMHEAAAAMNKARELLHKYELDENEASLEAEGFKEEWHYYGWRNRTRWANSLVGTIAFGYSCGCYVTSSYYSWVSRYLGLEKLQEMWQQPNATDKLGRIGFVFYGYASDVDIALHAYDAARQMVVRLSKAKGREYPVNERYLVEMSFADGLVCGLREQFKNREAQTTRPTYSGEKLPVPVTTIEVMKAKRIEQYEKDALSHLTDCQNKKKKMVRESLADGYAIGKTLTISAGVEAGECAALEQARLQ